MATYNKFNSFVLELGKGTHHLHAAGDVLKVYASNVAPSATLDLVKTDLAEITVENGYPSAGTDIQNDYTETPAGTGTMTAVDVVWTASVGSFGPLQYIAMYNDTHASDALISWWNYGSAVTVLVGETFTVDFGASVLTIT